MDIEVIDADVAIRIRATPAEAIEFVRGLTSHPVARVRHTPVRDMPAKRGPGRPPKQLARPKTVDLSKPFKMAPMVWQRVLDNLPADLHAGLPRAERGTGRGSVSMVFPDATEDQLTNLFEALQVVRDLLTATQKTSFYKIQADLRARLDASFEVAS